MNALLTGLSPAAALLFWGWCMNVLPLAAVLAVSVAASRLLPWRWAPSAQSLRAAAGWTLLPAALCFVYALATGALPRSLFQGLVWQPLALMPLMLVQSWSPQQRLPWVALRRTASAEESLDFSGPFVVICLLAAAAVNQRSEWFFPAALLLLTATLLPRRRRGAPLLAWMIAATIAGTLAFGLQRSLADLQAGMEGAFIEWFSDYYLEQDSDRSVTRMGALGRIKLSSRVVLRVRPQEAVSPPLRLMEASYQRVSGSIWTNPKRTSRGIAGHGGVWPLQADALAPGSAYRIEASVRDGEGILPLPLDTMRLEQLRVASLEQTGAGSLKVRGAPSSLRFIAFTGLQLERPPEPQDLETSPALNAALDSVLRELGLGQPVDPARTAAALEQFFGTYRYTLDLQDAGGNERSLTDFLLRNRAGHCEYFASATVLLMRRAGIPARYAVGYSAQDYDEDSGSFLVRRSDAHAWALVFTDGRWRELDTTPADWAAQEQEAAPFWQGLLRIVHSLWFEIVLLLSGPNAPAALMALLVGPVLLLTYWLWRRLRSSMLRRTATPKPAPLPQLRDGPFGPLARMLEARLPQLGEHETAAQWVARAAGLLPDLPAWERAVNLFYRLRYDPQADIAALRQELRQLAANWGETTGEKMFNKP